MLINQIESNQFEDWLLAWKKLIHFLSVYVAFSFRSFNFASSHFGNEYDHHHHREKYP